MVIKDDLGRTIHLEETPQRIVSLVPSITELLFDLGLENSIVGVTKFCVHPKSLKKSKKIIGGTKTIKADIIRELSPDIVFSNKEENDREQVNELMNDLQVFVSDIKTIKDALKFNAVVGNIFGVEDHVNKINKSIEDIFTTPLFQNQNVLYLIWQKPLISVGGDTYISDTLLQLGLNNIVDNKTRYPIIESSEIKKMNLDFIFLSSEPFPFKTKHLEEIQQLNPKAKVILVDGEAFSWYGSRLCHINSYFKELHTELS